MKFRFAIMSMATAFAVATPALAQRGWETIGFQTIGAGTDRDSIRVRGNERHRQVRVCAVNQPFRLLDADAYYANGNAQDIAGAQRVRAGTCTAAFDLNGRRRNLTRVALTYDKLGRRAIPPLVRIQAR